jgi:cobalamin biosynthesis Mg chelatase CobN
MRKFGIATALLLLAAAIALAQTSQQSGQSATDQAKGAASSAAGAVKSGAETGYNKTKEGAEKAYGAAKGIVTGSSSEQATGEGQTEQHQAAGTEGTSQQAGKLPKTASPLPLLGLLGLAALSLGAWKARLPGR